jgi:putative protein-disulfide isomerase
VNPSCDPELGACLIPLQKQPIRQATETALKVYYDPMCSWCWGMSPVTSQLSDWCTKKNVPFSIVMGGLRAGGGDPWNAQFINFLRREWRHINNATGQPFSFKLLDRASFQYDTEPACRAVETAKSLLLAEGRDAERDSLKFFSAVQRKFYVDADDPKNISFYESVCAELQLDFQLFSDWFQSTEMHQLTMRQFALTHELGCRGFPSVIGKKDGHNIEISVGYCDFAKLESKLADLV